MNMVFRTSFAFFGLPIAPFKKGSYFLKEKILQTNLYCWLSDSWLLEDFILGNNGGPKILWNAIFLAEC